MEQQRLEDINELIIQIASGNYDARKPISDEKDDFDALITGINMLGEELKHTTVSKDYLNSIFSGIIDLLLILSPDNTIKEVNSSVTSHLQYSPEDLQGKPVSSIIKGSNKALKQINNLLKKNNCCHGIEREFRTKEGSYIPVSCSASYLYDKLGNKTGVLYIAKDISHLKKIEEQLISKNKELDTFVYKVSHDLKGPLSSILGITSLVEDEIKDPTALKYFDLIRKCSENLDTILKNLLQLALMEQIRKEKSKICFDKFIRNITDIYCFQPNHSTQNKIRIEICQEKDFYNNEKMLHSVVQNLIDNAVKYKKPSEPAEILITVSEIQDGIQIKIKDKGIGIKPEYKDKVFSMFFRGSYSSEGSGLGLYMAKSYVERMGGDISFDSNDNCGTEFTVNLPCLKAQNNP